MNYTTIGPTTTYEQLDTQQKESYYFSAKHAAQQGNFGLVQSLFDKHGHNLFLMFDEFGYSLLHHACYSRLFTNGFQDNSHVYQMVKKIIVLGCSVNATDTTKDTGRLKTLTPLEHIFATTQFCKLSVAVMLFRMGGIFRPINDEKYKENWTLVKQNCMTAQEKQFKCGYALDDTCALKVFPKEIIDIILLSSARLLRDEHELSIDVQYSCS